MTVERRRCEQCERNRDTKSFVGPRGRVCKTCRRATARKNARRTHLMKTYGLTLEDYELLMIAQGGACAVCRGTRPYELHVDHDHAVERTLTERGINRLTAVRRSIRGLLCRRCNKLLRDVRDSPQVLRALAEYVESPPAQGVLSNVTAGNEVPSADAHVRQGSQAA